MPYVIFGASAFGQTAYLRLKSTYKIEGFCDNSTDKQGSEFCGLPVIAPQDLRDKNVIIASAYNIEIAKQLTDMGITRFHVAFDDGKGGIDVSLIDLSEYGDLSVCDNKICLMCENNSGSNTYAVGKLAKSFEYTFVSVNERKKDSNYYYSIFTSKIILKTHDSSNLDGHINIQLWHGIGLKPLGYMSKTASKFAEAKHKNWRKLDAVFSYSKMYNLILSACYGVPENKFYITGAPRNDFLFCSDGRKNLIDMLGKTVMDKKIILYAPTYREDVYGLKTGAKEAYLYNIKGIDLTELDDFLGRNNCIIVMKLHPYDVEECSMKISGLKNIKLLHDSMLSEKEIDFYEVLNAFDALITDYSSIFSDYLLLNRPIIFLPVDLEQYSKEVDFLFEPYDFWTPGAKATDYLSLKNKIQNVLGDNDEFEQKRKEISRIFHKYIDGKSTDRTLECIKMILSNN